MPDGSSFGVPNVRALVGGRRMVDVMECKTQRALEMSMRDFEQYFESKDRRHIYNVISLEFSQSKLEAFIKRPKVVDSLDWIDLVWPQHLKMTQIEQTNKLVNMKYPKVQKYCLMSVAGCYTDFHIDFGGTSVWYHILKGGKVFWLIEPSNENLSLYERWTMSGNQGDIFFGDMVSRCQRIELVAGNSLLIPSGWIHAVYTPHDSLVFGGNFLHSFNIPMQLRIAQLEERLHVPNRFRFPFFSEVLWYALERYVHCLTETSFLDHEYQEKNCISRKSSQNGEEKENKEYVHLTPIEYKGLQKLMETLEGLPKSKRCIPEGIADADGLLIRAKKLLVDHSGDDRELAVTGKAKAFWPVARVSNMTKLARKPKVHSVATLPKKTGTSSRIRRVRCKQCEACVRDDCMECVFCKDMRKHGGPGTMKQSCILRRCMNPILPSSAREGSVPQSPNTSPCVEQPSFEKHGKRAKKGLESADAESAPKIAKVDVEPVEVDVNSPPLRPVVPRVFVKRVSSSELSRYAVRPLSQKEENSDGKILGLNQNAWLNIFKLLDHQDLSNCMAVCRDFLKWCGSPCLWRKIDLSEKKVTKNILQSVVRKAPVRLDLSRSNVSYNQLLWLIQRSPALREMYLAEASWASIAALNTASCPPLSSLDVSWSSGFTDSHLRQLLSTPSDARPGQEISSTRLQFCQKLFIAGTEITDAGVKVIVNNLPKLKSIDISACQVTSEGVKYLLNASASALGMLNSITAQNCNQVNSSALQLPGKLPNVRRIDLRGCPHVTEAACKEYIEKSNGTLFMQELRLMLQR